jgi:hypothetical protein
VRHLKIARLSGAGTEDTLQENSHILHAWKAMAMTSGEAKKVAQKWVADTRGSQFGAPDSVFEVDSYFIFDWNKGGQIGPGPAVVDKRDGRVFEYGSGWGTRTVEELPYHQMARAGRESVVRRSFPEYDMRKHYRVIIHKIHDHPRLLEMLDSFELRYVIPEIEAGVIWRVAKRYDKELLKKRLAQPTPITFRSLGSLEQLYQLLGSDERGRLCELSIEDYQEPRKTYDPLKAKPEELEPEW